MAACRKQLTSQSGEKKQVDTQSAHCFLKKKKDSVYSNRTYFFFHTFASRTMFLNVRPVAQMRIRLGESYWTETLDRNIGGRCWTEAVLTNHSSAHFCFQPSKPHFNQTTIRTHVCGHRLDRSLRQQRANSRVNRSPGFLNYRLETSTGHSPPFSVSHMR